MRAKNCTNLSSNEIFVKKINSYMGCDIGEFFNANRGKKRMVNIEASTGAGYLSH